MAPVLLFLAIAAPAPARPDMRAEIHCVALLGLVASAQAQGAGWADLPRLKDDGGRYAAIVGEAAMQEGGRTREAVGDLIMAEVAALRRAGPLQRPPVDACIARMNAALAEDGR